MLVQIKNRCYVNTDKIRAIRTIDDGLGGQYYEVYVDNPGFVPYVATPEQFLKIQEAMNGNSD